MKVSIWRSQLNDYWIQEVNDYIVEGKRNSRGEPNVRFAMIMAIEDECGIHPKGIESGHIEFGRYKKEIRSRKKYWDRVKKGETTNSCRGYEKERAGLFRVGEKNA